ncbi:hypothetical protein GTO10_04685 [Candidatus Saccharibacteria bacterium]|nr:hypothetical protein [Candidatus Saccharibacteria bacterium]
MLLNFAILIASAAVLARASVFLIEKLTVIAVKLKVSEYLVGFILMAIATSLPELVVGFLAALSGNPTLSLGNVVGSNIANMTLVLGLATLIAGGLRIQVQVRNQEIFYMDLIALVPLVMLIDGKLTRTEGLILLFFFALYIYNLITQSREYHKAARDHRTKRSLIAELGLFVLGMLILLGSANFLVRSGEDLALGLGIPSILIGVFIVALATSLPELSSSITAARERKGAIVMGNILGSTVTNSTLVLGITALIHPITLERPDILITSAVALIVTLAAFTQFVRTGYRLSQIESLALVLGYTVYIIVTELFYGATL